MKQKIYDALVLAKPSIDKSFAGVLASQLEKTVTEESGIAAAIESLNAILPLEGLATEYSKYGDQRADGAVKTYKSKNPGSPNPAPPKEEVVTTLVDEPNAAILAQLKALQDQVNKQNTEKAVSDKRAQLVTLLGDKKIDASLASLITITDQTDLDALMPTIEATFSALKQNVTTNGLKENSFFPGGGGGADLTGANAAASIDAWAASKIPAK